MSDIRLDHFITAANVDNIDAYLDEYRAAGFRVGEQTVKHNPGLRNGFIRFGPEYLEFVWVEDEELFQAGADEAMFKPRLRELRAGYRPFGIGIDTRDVRALHDEWAAKGIAVPDVVDSWARDMDRTTPPVWSFLPIPPSALGGALAFGLTYHTANRDVPRKVRIAPNGTYAIAGITFVSDEAEERAAKWRDLLAPGEQVQKSNGVFSVYVKPHTLEWLSALEYQEQYGLSYKPAPHGFGEMSIIHVLSDDLDETERQLGVLERAVVRIPDKRTGVDTLIVPPDERDGFTMSITEKSAEGWLRERTAATGEKIELE